MPDMTPRRAGARCGAFSSCPHCSSSPPRHGARSGSMPLPKSACAPTPGRRRRQKPAGLCVRQALGGGFPFRFEVRCDDASVSLVSQTAGAQAPFTARLGEIMVIAQIYQPKLLIAEFKAPATLADRGQPPSMKVNWTIGRSSVVGLPDIPQRASIVFDNPSIDRINGPVRRRSRAPAVPNCTAASPRARRRTIP